MDDISSNISRQWISMIVAASENNAIGKAGKLLWHLPNDMKFFKNSTWALPVIMGRKTYESLGKALNGRSNYVVSRNLDLKLSDAVICGSLQAAITKASGEMQTNELMIIGGGELYKEGLAVANRIYLTRVQASFEDADAFFPEIPKAEWQLVKSQPFAADEKHSFGYTFEIWERFSSAL